MGLHIQIFFRYGGRSDNQLDAIPFFQESVEWFLKIEHFGFGSQVYQMGPTIEEHVRKEFFLVNLTSFGTRNSNANGNLVFDQVRQIIVGAVTGGCLDRQISGGIGSIHTTVDKKQIRLMFF